MENIEQPLSPRTHAEIRDILDVIRKGTEYDGEKWVRRPTHLVNRDVWETVLRHLRSRGEFFQAPYPYYLDGVEHLLMRVSAKPDRDLGRMLRRQGFLDDEPHTRLLAKNLESMAQHSPVRRVHRISFMSDAAIYIYASVTEMIKVSPEEIQSVPIGTDGVVLIAEDVGDWPSTTDLQPHIDRLRPLVGGVCTRALPGLPLTDLLSTRFSHESILTAEQAHQMFLTRILFMVAASRYSLWPLILFTGDQDTGKSTGFELLLTLLSGEPGFVKSMPTREGDLIASITNNSICAFDNIDGIDFESAKHKVLSDYLCHLATGAKLDMRKLFADNVRLTYEVHNHGCFTARVNPFTRPDVMRRTIHIEMDAPGGERIDKDTLKARVLEQRPAMLAELLLRAQNILRAHAAFGKKTYIYDSEMVEYEAFTLRCAEYEGSLNETQALWRTYMTQYRRSITERNPIVHAVRLWLGSSAANPGRQVTPTTLFSELQSVYTTCRLHLPYKSPTAFGKHIALNLPPLRIIGYEEVPTRNNKEYVFRPNADELEACKLLYRDASDAALKADLAILSRERPMDFANEDISDMNPPFSHRGVIQ
jgi:hypothetical protein